MQLAGVSMLLTRSASSHPEMARVEMERPLLGLR